MSDHNERPLDKPRLHRIADELCRIADYGGLPSYTDLLREYAKYLRSLTVEERQPRAIENGQPSDQRAWFVAPSLRCTCRGGLSDHKHGCPLYRPPVTRGA
jgi:hypothetical protein